ncbi:hypothetical protein [Rubritalea sp.]|uniref:hypothetical protein n=1 Tax=Rubritalea sp. TaxID=2109375 RepID=UPI003EFA2DB5
MMPTVTRFFIWRIIRNGRLTEARRRFEAGTSNAKAWDMTKSSCWSLICEEVIDTDHNPEVYDAVYSELIRRRFSAKEIDDMRRLAWRSAGWLNYDMMLWDWCNLDEKDIRTALELKYEKRLIRKIAYEQDLITVSELLDRDKAVPKN